MLEALWHKIAGSSLPLFNPSHDPCFPWLSPSPGNGNFRSPGNMWSHWLHDLQTCVVWQILVLFLIRKTIHRNLIISRLTITMWLLFQAFFDLESIFRTLARHLFAQRSESLSFSSHNLDQQQEDPSFRHESVRSHEFKSSSSPTFNRVIDWPHNESKQLCK